MYLFACSNKNASVDTTASTTLNPNKTSAAVDRPTQEPIATPSKDQASPTIGESVTTPSEESPTEEPTTKESPTEEPTTTEPTTEKLITEQPETAEVETQSSRAVFLILAILGQYVHVYMKY